MHNLHHYDNDIHNRLLYCLMQEAVPPMTPLGDCCPETLALEDRYSPHIHSRIERITNALGESRKMLCRNDYLLT